MAHGHQPPRVALPPGPIVVDHKPTEIAQLVERRPEDIAAEERLLVCMRFEQKGCREITFDSSIRLVRNSGNSRCMSCVPVSTLWICSGIGPSWPAWKTLTFISPLERHATAAANASAPTPE